MRTCVLLMLCMFTLGSCAQVRTVRTRIYEDRRTGVALRRSVKSDAVPLAKGYSHPARFGVEDLKYLLSQISFEYKGLFGWSELKNVFTADELYRVTPHLVDAFAKATPDDEVLFRLTTAKPGAIFSSERFTNGILFVKDNRLDCLFANIDIKPNSRDIYDGNPRNYYSGVLWRLAEGDWQSLVEGEKGTHYNWIELDWERGLEQKRQAEKALREELERRRAIERTRRPGKYDWEDWEPDAAVEQETQRENDVYFPPLESP